MYCSYGTKYELGKNAIVNICEKPASMSLSNGMPKTAVISIDCLAGLVCDCRINVRYFVINTSKALVKDKVGTIM